MSLCYFSHQSLKWHSSYEKVGIPLIPPYFSQCYSSRSVSSGSHLLLAHTHLCSQCLPRSSYCWMTGQPFQVSWLWYVWFIISYHVSCKLIYQMIMFFGMFSYPFVSTWGLHKLQLTYSSYHTIENIWTTLCPNFSLCGASASFYQVQWTQVCLS